MTRLIDDSRNVSDSTALSSSYAEKRSGKDRRTHRFPKLKYLLLSGKRSKVRRQEDLQRTFYFDRYSANVFAAIVAILLLSVFDALLTLYLIDNGSTELNPVMSYFLRYLILRESEIEIDCEHEEENEHSSGGAAVAGLVHTDLQGRVEMITLRTSCVLPGYL